MLNVIASDTMLEQMGRYHLTESHRYLRPEGESSNPPAPLDTQNLFKTLEEWNHHLKAHASLSQTPFA